MPSSLTWGNHITMRMKDLPRVTQTSSCKSVFSLVCWSQLHKMFNCVKLQVSLTKLDSLQIKTPLPKSQLKSLEPSILLKSVIPLLSNTCSKIISHRNTHLTQTKQVLFFFFWLINYSLSQLSCLFLPFSFYVSFKMILKCYDFCSPLSTIRMNHVKLLVGQLVVTYKCG